MEEKDRKAILHSVSGYASKVAKMISLTTTFKELSCPPTPVQSDDEGEEMERVIAPNSLQQPAFL